jgi:hypothetical protein
VVADETFERFFFRAFLDYYNKSIAYEGTKSVFVIVLTAGPKSDDCLG